MADRVTLTPAAADLIHKLRVKHGPLMFLQSTGCCDGSAPMCYPQGEFRVGERDVMLGFIEECPFYMSEVQFQYWQHTHLTIDIVPGGRGASFSVESPEGVRFLTRSRLFTDEETAELDASGPPPHGPLAGKLPQ